MINKAREVSDKIISGGNSTVELPAFYWQIRDDVKKLQDGGFTREEIAGFLDSHIHPSVLAGLRGYLGIAKKEEPVTEEPKDSVEVDQSQDTIQGIGLTGLSNNEISSLN